MTNRWPPQPGDLVKVENATLHPNDRSVKMIGGTYMLGALDSSGCVVKGHLFNLSDLSPAEPPETIQQFGRTYRLVEEGRTDAERLDWLERAQPRITSSTTPNGVVCSFDDWGTFHASLRAAIDAAMSATNEPAP